jgi:hypothetical protein
MKKIILIAMLTSLTSNAGAFENLGIGVSIKQEEEEVYIPYKLSDTRRIEGIVGISHSYQSRVTRDPEAIPGASSYSSKTEFQLVGAGIFTTHRPTENSSYYLGFRAAFMKAKADGSLYLVKSSSDGVMLAPVVGYEYFIGSNFSLGADVALTYTHWENEDEFLTGINESKYIDKNISKTFIVRYYF